MHRDNLINLLINNLYMILLILFFSTLLISYLVYFYKSLLTDIGKLYIRIGEIPKNEKSKIYRGDSVIGEEIGVSVYDAVQIDNIWRIAMPPSFKEGQGDTYETLIQEVTQCRYEIEHPREVYLVSGKKIGIGSDGEPLIKNIKIIKNISEQFRKEQKPNSQFKLENNQIKPKFKKYKPKKRKKKNNAFDLTDLKN